MFKVYQVVFVGAITLAIVSASGHGHSDHSGDFGGDFDEIHKAGGKFEHLGTYIGKHHNPPKVIKIIKTVAVKVPVPVHIPKYIKYPVPFPVHVPKIIKIKEHVPFPVKEHHHESHENLKADFGGGDEGHHSFEGHSFGGSADDYQLGGQDHHIGVGDGSSGHGGEASGSYQHEEYSHGNYDNGLGGDLQQSYGGGDSYNQGFDHQHSQASPVNYHVVSQGSTPDHEASSYYSTGSGGIHQVPAPLLAGGSYSQSHGYH
ncbi:hypothetical protein DMENIID0001_036860 [Sergentomyia squamirostris]